MKTLILTVGLPHSGKSEWAKKQGIPIVEPDAIRLALHGEPFIALAEPFVWATAKVMIGALFLAGHDEVILCATNATRKRREDWVSDDWTRKFMSFADGPEACRKRIFDAGYDDMKCDGLIAAVERMHAVFEPVESSERRHIVRP